MSAGGDTEWVDRAPAQSKKMREAYAGLKAAEDWLAETPKDNAAEHAEAVDIVVSWHAEIGRIALGGK